MNESQMAREIREIPDVVVRQTREGLETYRAIGARLRALDPQVLVTSARGSSDHAALYLKYLVETRIGIPVASVGPSVASIYAAPLRLHGAALVAISQSGASPDLLALLEAGRAGGALTAALVNAPDAPAANLVEMSAPLLAGPEVAVAATKTYVASLVAAAAIVAEWARDETLAEALPVLPEALSAALACDWSAVEEAFGTADSAFCISRGPALTIAYEAALKLKETCRLHAEGFSAAEVLHGPAVLAGERLRALVFAPADAARASVLETARRMAGFGTGVWLVDSAGGGANVAQSVPAPHPALVPACQAVSFYRFVERLSRARGCDPDRPAHLSKVTRTL